MQVAVEVFKVSGLGWNTIKLREDNGSRRNPERYQDHFDTLGYVLRLRGTFLPGRFYVRVYLDSPM